jgi:hypothetical protein
VRDSQLVYCEQTFVPVIPAEAGIQAVALASRSMLHAYELFYTLAHEVERERVRVLEFLRLDTVLVSEQ